jgi:hypothetical protein
MECTALFPWQQWLHECATMPIYIHFLTCHMEVQASWFMMFWRSVSYSSSRVRQNILLGLLNPWEWRQYTHLKCWESITVLLSLTTHKTRILNINAVETSQSCPLQYTLLHPNNMLQNPLVCESVKFRAINLVLLSTVMLTTFLHVQHTL